MKIFFFLITGFLFIVSTNLMVAQDTIVLKNPSFEDVPRMGLPNSPPIFGWHDCGSVNFPHETPPDILPTYNAVWGVTMQAIDGKTYLSLATRYNGSYEFVSQ